MNIEYFNEIWKDIKGYEGLYQVSNFGRVKSLDRYVKRKGNRGNVVVKGQIRKTHISSEGYVSIGLNKNNKQTLYFVHRLVAEAFLPNPHNYPIINHKNEVKTENIVWINEDGSIDYNKTTIEWCSYSYNVNYGTRNSKLSKSVLQYDKEGNYIQEYSSTMEIQRKFGFGNGHIQKCCNGKQKTAYGYVWRYK